MRRTGSEYAAGRHDVPLLFVTRVLRMFAYGAISLVLVLYLAEIGFGEGQIGLLLTMTLLGDTAVSLWLTTSADRVGRRWMLVFGAGLMVLGGAVFAVCDGFVSLLLAATAGVISPSGNEVGPFLAIEQAALAQATPDGGRTRAFAWYTLAGSFATAAGALVCGALVQGLEACGVGPLARYRVILLGYAGIGAFLAALFVGLSAASEAPRQALPSGRFLGLHQSRRVVAKLSALFALDAFAGGFILQTVVAYWFHARFGTDAAVLGGIFFATHLLSGFSALAAAALARRFGLVNTMVFSHAPSNVLLVLLPFMPNLSLAVAVLLLRSALSQMDVPTRQSYTAAVVRPDERSAAAGVTGVARTTGAALAPAVAGLLPGGPALAGAPFVIAGFLKLAYDGLLYRSFRNTVPPEESPVDEPDALVEEREIGARGSATVAEADRHASKTPRETSRTAPPPLQQRDAP
jgi:MFS family permease